MNDNIPATYNANEIHHDWTPPLSVMGNQVNIIDEDAEPHVLRNIARYYDAKRIDGVTEPWAAGMARRLRAAANDSAQKAAA